MTKTQLLDMSENIAAITGKFKLHQLKLDKDLEWFLTLNIKQALPKSYARYQIKFVFDPQPYLDDIEVFEKEISRLSSEPSLPTFSNPRIAELQKSLDDTRTKMEERQAECETITFVARTQKVEYKADNTMATFNVTDNVINDINDLKDSFKEYIAVFEPLF
jgi:hypothetical protein